MLTILTRCVYETQCPRQWPIPTKADITRTHILIPVERSCHKVKDYKPTKRSNHKGYSGEISKL